MIGEGALVCGSRFATATYAERFEYFSSIPDPLNQGDWKVRSAVHGRDPRAWAGAGREEK
jgi:hypothetical protein